VTAMAQWRRGIALMVVAVLWTLGGGVVSSHQKGPKHPKLTIVDYKLVRVEHVGRNVREFTYRARLKNHGPAITGAKATIDKRHRSLKILDGDLKFGPVKSGQSATSLDTFTFRHHGWLPARARFLRWDIDASGGNRPPVADAGADRTVAIGARASLDGRRSTDPDGDALTFRWELRSRPAASRAALTAAGTATPSFAVDVAGRYVAALVVRDSRGAEATDTVTITTPNRPPSANAGPDVTVRVRDRAMLSGAGSSDPDGDPLTYRWRLLSRPAGSVAVPGPATGVASSLVPDLAGRYVLQLVVNDGRADSAPDEVVVATANSAPVARAGAGATAAVGETVRLDGSTSSDADGDSLRFAWTLVARPTGSGAGLVNPTDVRPSIRIDRTGLYRLRLVVSDGVATSAPDEVEIDTRNTAPVAHAGSDAHVALGETVTLDGSGSTDVDGDTLTFSWSFTSVPAGSAAALSSPSSVTPQFSVDRPGTYVAQLIVSDGVATSVADTVVVTTRNSAPVARAGADVAAVAQQRVPLDGSASSDPEGSPLTFAWALTVVPPGSRAVLQNPASSAPFFVADRNGLYVAQLVVSDGELSSDPDTVSISTTNTVPVAAAGPDQLDVPSGSLVALNGTSSSDADGHALTYRWALVARPAGSAAVLSDAASPVPTFTADRAGEYVAQLVVSDGLTDSAPDTVLMRTANRAPTASAGPDQAVALGSLVDLDASGSNDPDGDELAFSWQLLSAPSGSTAEVDADEPGMATFEADVAGRYTIRVTVTDPSGASASDEVDIDAQSGGQLDVPEQATFGEVQVGGSATAIIALTNSGEGAVGNITAVATGDYVVDTGGLSTCLTGSVAPGAGCVLQVIFTPTAAGPREGTLSIDSDGAGGPDDVALSGEGVALPVVSIEATDGAASEVGPDEATFTVTRSGAPSTPLTVRYTVAGTATNVIDYEVLTGIVQFGIGQSVAEIAIFPISDGLIEGDETVIVTLVDDASYDLGAVVTATATIADPVIPIVTISVVDGDASEVGLDPGTLRFTRTGDLSAPLNVTITRGGTATSGTDYANFLLLVSFGVGQATVDRFIVPVADALVEGPETVIVTLVDGPNYDLGATTTALVTIADQPVPVVTVQAVDASATEAGDRGLFRFTRTGNLAFSLAISLSRGGTATNMSDYANISTTLTFPAGAATVDREVVPVSDTRVEGIETVILTVLDGANYDVGVPASATVQIAD